jgi:hypothetical protein
VETAVATELSSGAISSILEAVPGIATVLRSPIADAIVNLSRAAADIIPFDPKDAHELIRYAVRRGLIRSDEGDRVTAEIELSGKGASRPPMRETPKVPINPVPPRKMVAPQPPAPVSMLKKPAAPKPAAKKPAAKPAAKAKVVHKKK